MRKWISVLIGIAALVMMSASVFASVSDNQVTSQKIMEADGTSGQNTNSGSGVKTGHIQNAAVTTDKIANGAVTDAKISGQIMASKISSTGLNADTVDGKHAADLAPAVHAHPTSQVTGLDAALAGKAEITHNHDSLYQQRYGNVAIVARTGGDYTDPYVAMNDLAAWCGTASASNPCLLKIMPGFYNIGSNRYLRMVSYVDIEGSGENVTTISGSSNDYYNYDVGVVEGASNAELRNITVENANGYYMASAIYNYNASPKITNVTANSFGSPTASYGIRNIGSSPIMLNVKISASGSNFAYGVHNSDSSPIMTNVTASGIGGPSSNNRGWGIYNIGGSSPVITNARLTASRFGIQNDGGASPVITNSTITSGQIGIVVDPSSGGVFFNVITSSLWNQGTLAKCINVYDSGYNPIACQ